MAELWGSTGAMWRDMLVAEALVTVNDYTLMSLQFTGGQRGGHVCIQIKTFYLSQPNTHKYKIIMTTYKKLLYSVSVERCL